MSTATRQHRQVQLPELGEAGQHALARSTVLIIGLGGLGCPAAQYLAGAGVGTLQVLDRDVVELSNLQRQTLFTEADIGQPKAEVAARRLEAMNGDIAIEALHTRLSDTVLHTRIEQADVVLDCTDNFPSRFAINRACLAARRPLVSGAGIRLGGQLGVFRNDQPGAACYRCLFDESGAEAERCEDAGVLGPVVGVVGAMQALEAVRLLAMDAEPHSHWWHWDAKTRASRHHALHRDPQCPEHRPEQS